MTMYPAKKMGFAKMTPEERKRLASLGGKAAHAAGTAHEWNSIEAAKAGKIGGQNSRSGKGRLTDKQVRQEQEELSK